MELTGIKRIANRGAQAVALAGIEAAAVNRNYLLMVRNSRRRVMLKLMVMIKMIKSCGQVWKDLIVKDW